MNELKTNRLRSQGRGTTGKAAVGVVFALALGFVVTAAIARPHANETMRWNLELRSDGDVQFELRQESGRSHWRSNQSAELKQFSGLTRLDLSGARKDITFALVRDAGTMRFQGRVGDGQGTGTAIFEPDAGYRRMMNERTGSDLNSDEQYVLFVHDVSRDYIAGLDRAGYSNLGMDDLLAFAIHGVRPEWIRELREVGYDRLEADQLLAMRIHGVDAAFAREIRAGGN
jgi:hypothetical protein